MINVTKVAAKLENILNGIDSDMMDESYTSAFLFQTKTQGFHLDHIIDIPHGKNFIPVFVSQVGGSYNPVPNLKESSRNILINIYFPIRFKDNFYDLEDKIAEWFVGKIIDFGDGNKALCNTSVPDYGEIIDQDLLEFKTWSENEYQQQIEIMEPWMSMTFNLYLTTVANDYVWGNDVKTTLKVFEPTLHRWLEIEPTFEESSIQSQSQTMPEQKINTMESKSLPFGTTYGSSFSVYLKKGELFNYVLEKWAAGESQSLRFKIQYEIPANEVDGNTTYVTFARQCFLQSNNAVIKKGSLILFTFTFGTIITAEEIGS